MVRDIILVGGGESSLVGAVVVSLGVNGHLGMLGD